MVHISYPRNAPEKTSSDSLSYSGIQTGIISAVLAIHLASYLMDRKSALIVYKVYLCKYLKKIT